MKRAFLFGLGTFLILSIIWALLQFQIISAILALVMMPISVVVIRSAQRALPNRSRLHAVFGWLLGFFVLDVVFLAVIGVAFIATR